MEQETASNLASELEQVSDVVSAGVVYFEDRGGTSYTSLSNLESPSEDDHYGVSFYAYDMLIPKEVIDVISGYDSGGILTHPDIGVVVPRQE